MLSSGDVTQMFAAQNAAFAQQGAYAQQLTPGNGLGAWGSPQGGGYRMPGMPGMPGASAISYAPGGFASASYGGGNRMAGNIMSGIGGAATLAGAGLGIASMFGSMGRISPLIDPIAGGMAGFGRMGMLGAGLGAMPALAVGGLASQAVSSFVGGGQQQMMIGSQLSQFGHMNPSSRSGAGFSRDDAQAIGNQIRSLSNVPELMTSVQELTALIPKLKGMGVMSGVRDATEFNQRFKEAVKTVRDMSKVLGTTMEEASEFFAHSRSVGFLGKSDQLKNALNARYSEATTGMSSGQFMQMQRAGADMGTSMGIGRGRSTKAVTNIAQTLHAGLESGQISEEVLSNLTGLEGPEAIRASAEQLTGLTAQLAKSTAPGRLSMFGLAKFGEGGKYLGIDEDMAAKYKRGEIGRQDLMKRVQGFSKEQKMAVSYRGDSMAMDFAAQAGPGGMARFFGDILADRGYESENAQGLYMKKHLGMSENQIELFQSMKGVEEQDSSSLGQRAAQEAAISDRTDPTRVFKRIKTKLYAGTFGKVEQAGAEVSTSIGKAYDEWIDDMVGRHVVTMTKEGAQKMARAFSTTQGKKDLEEAFALAAGVDKTGAGKQATSFGKAIAGFGALAAGPLAPVLGGGMVMDAMFGGKGLNKAGLAVGKTLRNMVRGLGAIDGSSGRSASDQFDMMKSEFGAASESAMDDKIKALQAFGKSNLSDAQRNSMDLVYHSVNKEGADASQKLDLLTEGMTHFTQYSPGEMHTGFSVGRKKNETTAALAKARESGLIPEGMSDERALAWMASEGRIDTKLARGSAEDSLHNLDLQNIEARTGEARAGMSKAFGGEVGQTLQDKAGLATAMSKVLGEGADGLKKVSAVLESGDPAKIAATLKEHGVSGKDLDSFKGAISGAYKKHSDSALGWGGTSIKDMKGALDKFRGVQAAGNIEVFQTRAREAAGDVSDVGLSKALMGFGTMKSYDAGAVDKVSSSLKDLRERIKNETNPEKRRALIESAGAYGKDLENSLIGKDKTELRMRGTTQSVESLATRYGLKNEEIIAAAGSAAHEGKVKIDDKLDILDKIKATAAGVHGTSKILGPDTLTAGEKDKELLDTLKGVKKNIELNSTMMAALHGKEIGLTDEQIRRSKLNAVKEQPKLDEKGSPIP